MPAASATAPPHSCPATSRCTSAPICSAALTAARVAPLIDPWSCSAITRTVILIPLWIPAFAGMICRFASDHLRFVLQFVQQGCHIGHLHAAHARLGLAHLQ